MIDLDALCPALEKLESDIEIAKGGHLQKSFRHGLNKPDPVCESMLEQGFEFGEFERRLILTAMLKADGNVSQAARLLGLSRAQIAYRLEKLNYDNK